MGSESLGKQGLCVFSYGSITVCTACYVVVATTIIKQTRKQSPLLTSQSRQGLEAQAWNW